MESRRRECVDIVSGGAAAEEDRRTGRMRWGAPWRADEVAAEMDTPPPPPLLLPLPASRGERALRSSSPDMSGECLDNFFLVVRDPGISLGHMQAMCGLSCEDCGCSRYVTLPRFKLGALVASARWGHPHELHCVYLASAPDMHFWEGSIPCIWIGCWARWPNCVFYIPNRGVRKS